MTAWVADYVSRISPADLRAAGVVGVCRYLADTTSIGKIIGLAEYNELRTAGIGVLLNWEQAATDWLGGAAKGAAHAGSAVRQARALGYPAGSVVVGSADFDMSASQWSGDGRAYATAFRDGLASGGYGAGVYGPYDVLTWVRQLGGFRVFWQAGMSTAWSAGRNASLWPGAHLRQRRHVTVGGHDADYNDIVQSDWQGDDMLTDSDIPVIRRAIMAYQDTGARSFHDAFFGDLVPAAKTAASYGPALAALASKVDSLTTAVTALAAGGTNVDTATILARIDQRAAEDAQRDTDHAAEVQALQAEIAELRGKLAAAAKAEAAALES